ncbi:DUF3784 domain-containing protein [Flavonifractor hominis]|uniref:DUF3784 domain-containing protein n=1 Tax=Flavonifractor hominis TaxID=3133178 RepID=A0ABV1ESL3_9FIRM
MDYICIFLGALFCAGGILFASGKGHVHLSAWKKMSITERERINIGPLCRNVGGMILCNGLLFLLKGCWGGFARYGFLPAMVVWMLAAGADLWYISTRGRYQRQ